MTQVATLAIDVHDAHRDSLKAMAARHGMRLSKLMEEFLIRASVEHDAEMRCRLRASLGELQLGGQGGPLYHSSAAEELCQPRRP